MCCYIQPLLRFPTAHILPMRLAQKATVGPVPDPLVWEGVATGRLSGTRSEEAWSELIGTVTDEMFAEFPVSAN